MGPLSQRDRPAREDTDGQRQSPPPCKRRICHEMRECGIKLHALRRTGKYGKRIAHEVMVIVFGCPSGARKGRISFV